MKLTINTNSFTLSDLMNFHEKPRKKGCLKMKRLRDKRNNKLFNKWFKKEHDYCLPINKIKKVGLLK